MAFVNVDLHALAKEILKEAFVIRKIVNANVRLQKMHVKEIYFATLLMENAIFVLGVHVAQKIRDVTSVKGIVAVTNIVSQD